MTGSPLFLDKSPWARPGRLPQAVFDRSSTDPHWTDVAGSRGRSEQDAGRSAAGMVVVLTGSVLVVFAAFCFAAAIWRELYPGTPPPRPDVRRRPRALLFALNGFLALVALAALFGVWFGRTGGT